MPTRSRKPPKMRCKRRSTSLWTTRCPILSEPSTTFTPNAVPEEHFEMSHEIPYIAAVMEGIAEEMARDPKVLYYGQDVAPNDDHDLVKAFGRDRIRVSPISETAEIGMAVGAAVAGYRPVVELLMAEFMLVAMNQVVNKGNRC